MAKRYSSRSGIHESGVAAAKGETLARYQASHFAAAFWAAGEAPCSHAGAPASSDFAASSESGQVRARVRYRRGTLHIAAGISAGGGGARGGGTPPHHPGAGPNPPPGPGGF